MNENKKSPQVAVAASEDEKLFINGDITINEYREILGLDKIDDEGI